MGSEMSGGSRTFLNR